MGKPGLYPDLPIKFISQLLTWYKLFLCICRVCRCPCDGTHTHSKQHQSITEIAGYGLGTLPVEHQWALLPPPSPPLPRSLPRCYLKLGEWRTQLEERTLTSSTISSVLQYYQRATEYDRSWYKAWHAWAFMNFKALLEYKKPATGEGCLKPSSHSCALFTQCRSRST